VSDFQCRREVRARKDHPCEEGCEGGIPAGETYTRFFSVYDGRPAAVKVCATCTALWDQAMADYPEHFRWGDGVAWGDLRAFLEDVA